MTSGNFGTEVIANRMYKEMVTFHEPGRASATAMILLVAIVPVMIYNIRRFWEQEAMR
jgi:alpha-glucoside transport system permease protein